MPFKRRSMFVYAWDLWHEGIEAALDRMQQLGINSITVSAHYHSGKFFLPHNPKKRVYYHGSGRVYYTPNRERYGVLQPQTGEAYDEYLALHPDNGDLFSAILAAAKARSIETLAWVVGFHQSELGGRFPEYTVQSAFGDSYRHAICPAHEETKQYVCAIIRDLAEGYADLDGIVMESFDYMGMLHGDHHELVGIERKNDLEKYMALCFCPVCTRNARDRGIDTDTLRADVCRAVDKLANSGEMTDPDSVPQYGAYLQMRSDVVEEVFRRVRRIAEESLRKPALYSTLWLAYGSDPRLSGIVPDRLSRYLDGWIACYPGSAEDVEAFVARAGLAIPPSHLAAGVRLVEPETTSVDQVRGYLEAYDRQGIQHLTFYNYGLSSLKILNGLGEYLRSERT